MTKYLILNIYGVVVETTYELLEAVAWFDCGYEIKAVI
jgi:hypothetical protein